jgi:hypothetical protein
MVPFQALRVCRLRVGFLIPALAAALLGCANSADAPTAPSRQDLAASGVGPCVRQCAETQMAQTQEEIERYRRDLAACNGDAACLAEAASVHETILAEIGSEFRGCKEPCR